MESLVEWLCAERLDYQTASRLARTSRRHAELFRRLARRSLVRHALALDAGERLALVRFGLERPRTVAERRACVGAASSLRLHRAALRHGPRVVAALRVVDASFVGATASFVDVARSLVAHNEGSLVPELFGGDVERARASLARAAPRSLAVALLTYALGWALFGTRRHEWRGDSIGDTYAFMPAWVDSSAAYEDVFVRGLELRAPSMTCALYERLGVAVTEPPSEATQRLLEYLDGSVRVSATRIGVSNAWRTTIFEHDDAAAALLARLATAAAADAHLLVIDGRAHGLPERLVVVAHGTTRWQLADARRRALASVVSMRRRYIVSWHERAHSLAPLERSSPINARGTVRCRLLSLFGDASAPLCRVK